MWDRIKLIPWTVRIREDEKIPRSKLIGMFKKELPGILNWAVQGCLLWQKFGLNKPTAVEKATHEYRDEMDVIENFVQENLLVLPEAKIAANRLYQLYTDWCRENGERQISQNRLGRKLSEKGFDRKRLSADRRTYWFGLGEID